jgi:hypothetical protein
MFRLRLRLERNDIELEPILVPGISRAALWDAYEIPVHNYNRQLRDLGKEIAYCRTRYREIYHNLKAMKHKVMADYEALLDRIWNDQKTGTYFKKGERFEPHHVTKQSNLVMWDGLTRFTELIAGETTTYFYFKRMGTGTKKPSYSDNKLEAEVAIADMRIDGDINSDGIVLKDTATFGTGVPSKTISEFCATDNDNSDEATYLVAYRVTIDRVEDRLGHIQDVTEVQESHSIIFQSVSNEI